MGDIVQTFANISWEDLTISTLIPAIITLVVCLSIIWVVMRILNKAIKKLPFDRTLHAFIRSGIKIALYAVTVLLVADTLHIPITSLVAALSVAGLAISLAVQGTLSNLAGGIMILVSKPFAVGDYIEAGGVSGTVLEIGLVYTKMMTPDNKIILVPNGDISAEKITNYTAEKIRRVDLTVGASYQHSIESVKNAAEQALKTQSFILSDPPPFINVIAYQSSNIEYTIRAWVDTENYWPVYFALMEEVKHAFDKNGISMAYNQIDVHMINK
jgi:small conductance mechanosensitive channel